MLRTRYDGRDIIIHGDYGAYAFPRRSAIGTTFLGSVLLRLPDSFRVTAYTYYDYKREVPVNLVLNREKYDIVYFDRSDLYYLEFLNEILDFARTGLVFLDLKNYQSGCGIGFASICFTDTVLEVEPCVFPV